MRSRDFTCASDSLDPHFDLILAYDTLSKIRNSLNHPALYWDLCHENIQARMKTTITKANTTCLSNNTCAKSSYDSCENDVQHAGVDSPDIHVFIS